MTAKLSYVQILNNFKRAYTQSLSEWVSSSFGNDSNKTVGTKRKRNTKKLDKSRKLTDHPVKKQQQPSPLTTGMCDHSIAVRHCGHHVCNRH